MANTGATPTPTPSFGSATRHPISRPNRARLDYYYRAVNAIILARQNPSSGLIPASVAVTTHGDYRDAWVRDNVYSILAVWGLALAYQKLDDGDGRAYELEHSTVKLMRGLLFSMMLQAGKVERFKNTQSTKDSLHAKYNTNTGGTVVGDDDWGHLQIDATGIFLLMLAQMTGGGMRIVYTLDEVDFIQNLVFYVEKAYRYLLHIVGLVAITRIRTPDYGIWERGNKSNHGIPELNCSSIGMVVAALLAIDGVNLFGARGGPASVIHVLPDEVTRNYTTLHSFLPRESNSKEIDAALLSVVGFPAFAVGDSDLAARTRQGIIDKLGGEYGCKRFLRDGHQTALEDHSRLHYEPSELTIFEGIECEWPLFFTYLILDGELSGDLALAQTYREALAPSSWTPNSCQAWATLRAPPRSPSAYRENFPLVPELYYVPKEAIDAEKAQPRSQKRLPNDNVPLVWANSLHFLGNLLHEGLLEPSQLDPLGRRISNRRDPHPDTVVQVILLSETTRLKKHLATFGVETQTLEEIRPIAVGPPVALVEIYATLGMNAKLGLSGRPKRPIGTLGTSRLYRIKGQLYAFTPHFMDQEHFYLTSDNQYFISMFEQELQFVQKNWFYPGRPTITVLLTEDMLGRGEAGTDLETLATYSAVKSLLVFIFRLKAGSCNGVRVRTGRIHELVSTTTITNLDFLINKNDIDWPLTLSELTRSTGGGDRLRTSRRPRLRRNSSSGNPLKSPIPRTESQNDLCPPSNVFKLRNHEEFPDDADSDPSSPREPLTLKLGDTDQTGDAILQLVASNNLYDQMDLAHYLHSCYGGEYFIEPLATTLAKLLEEIYSKAIALKLWSIARHSAGVLQKMADSLTINITDLIVRQKRVSVGSGECEQVIDTAVTPDRLKLLIYSSCTSDVREGPLVQELLTFLGSFIRSDPTLFDGILQLRLRSIVITLREEISRLELCNEDDAVEILMQMSPFEVKSLLVTTLGGPTLSAHATNQLWDAPKVRRLPGRGAALPSDLVFTVRSGGFFAGKFACIAIGGQEVPINRRGFNLVAIDLVEHEIVDILCFDTHWNESDSHALASYLNHLSPGIVVAGAVNDEASEKLTADAIIALQALGLTHVDRLGYRSSYCFVGIKGCRDPAVEDYVPPSARAAEIVEYALPRARIERVVADLVPSPLAAPAQERWGVQSRPRQVLPSGVEGAGQLHGHPPGGGATLPRDPTVSEKTPDEFNFAMLVEHFLSNFQDPAERQIAIELLAVIAHLQESQPGVEVGRREVDLVALIHRALRFFWEDWVDELKASKAAATPLVTLTAASVTKSKPKGDAPAQPPSELASDHASSEGSSAPIAKPADSETPLTLPRCLDFDANVPFARRLFYDLPQRTDRGTLHYLAAAVLCRGEGDQPRRHAIPPEILRDIYRFVAARL
ncbi:hypothetical protein L0F63_004762 [Massospora cicadina]|nr:hypothetical protein L0F63_004762 [Massospora cicadina]